MQTKPAVKGTVAKFFHPRTLGVMHTGIVVRVLKNGMVRVKFNVDDKTYTTYADNN